MSPCLIKKTLFRIKPNKVDSCLFVCSVIIHNEITLPKATQELCKTGSQQTRMFYKITENMTGHP